MSRYGSAWLGVGIAVVLVLAYLVYEVARPAGKEQFTARIIPSRTRVRPGEVVSFKLQLVDHNRRTQQIPRSARSGQPPRMTLYDSQGQQIGTYNFRYG